MKKTLCIFLLLFLSVLCAGALAANSGSCGEHVTWTLNEKGTLTISGTGAMNWEDGDSEEGFGWDRDQVKLVVIENGVTEIGQGAFHSCKNLTGIIIPASVTSVARFGNTHYSIAYDCPNLKAFIVDPGNQAYCSKDGVLFSKDMTCLYCCPQGITGKYTVPEKVREIDGAIGSSSGALGAFDDCQYLTEIVLPEGLETIGDGAFSGCSALREISIPNSVQYIGWGAFERCISLYHMEILNNQTVVEEHAFYECTGLTGIKMACSAQSGVFSGCKRLTDVIFLEGAESIKSYAFSGCVALKTLVIPDSLTTIDSGSVRDDGPFQDCLKLSSITVSARNKSAIRYFADHGFSKALNIRDVSMADCEIGKIADQEYTGKAIKPKITVKYSGVSLKEGRDYSLSYADNINVGKASVTVTGIGNCSGQKTVTFIINPKAVALSSLKAGGKSLTVKWKKGSEIDGYEIEYSLKKTFKGAKSVTISKAKSTGTVLEDLKSKKTYYVRIRAYKKVNNKKYYSVWSNALSKKTK